MLLKHSTLFIYLEEGGCREKEKEKNIDLWFHLFMHSLVDPCMCPEQGLNSPLGVLE